MEGVFVSTFATLDSAGLFAFLFNRLFLTASHPTPTQILFWDRILVRVSTFIDPLIGYTFGKSLLQVWLSQKH